MSSVGGIVARAEDLRKVYDGASATLRVLRALGWGPQLLNLGYYRARGLCNVWNLLPGRFRLAASQQRLVRKAVGLLDLGRGERVLDLACGRGQSSYYMAIAHPGIEVVGVDFLPENIAIASTLFAHTRGLTYEVGDAMELGYGEASFDKLLCLEAAFHFPDRLKFLREAGRVLRPGGRLVLVDFVWKDAERAKVLADSRTEFVRRTWGWKDFSAWSEYRAAVSSVGLSREAEYDWTTRVTQPLQGQFDALARLAASRWGRALLMRSNEMLRGFSRSDWLEITKSAEAHRFVHAHARYVVMVLRKKDA